MSLEELPKGWVYAAIGQLVGDDGVFVDGDWVESKDQDPDGDVRLIQLADVGDGEFRDRSARFLATAKARELGCTFLEKGDLLIARMPDPLGRCCIFPLDRKAVNVTVVDVCIVRVGSSPIDCKYLMYAINSADIRNKISDLQSGSTRKRISRGNLATIELPIAPLNEQRRIVAKIEELFSELDKGVESLATARAQLKVYREAVLQRCFLSGAAKEIPLSKTLLPRSWKWEKLSALATLITKGASPKWQGINYVEDESQTLFVTSENVRSNFMDLDKPKFVQNVFNEGQKRSILKVGDVLFNIVGASIGRAAIFDDGRSANINQAVALIRLEKRAIAEYVANFLNSALGQSAYMDKRVEVARANLSLKDVGDIEVPLPPPSEIQRVVGFIEASLSRIDALEQELDDEERRASALRQSILKRAFSGQLVPQDAADEPASELLERIRAEREGGGATKRPNNKKSNKEAA